MASFTDQLVAFNPYVSQIPVDDYVRVGMQKQLDYNKGVDKVQGYIDSVAGLEVLMPEQKDYLNQRINNLQQEVGRVVQADFSNQQLVNSVGALTSKIASDPIIQTSVASTQTYKQGIAAMKDAQAKGKSSISNEWDFQDQFSKWYNSKDITARFSGSFTPYTDVNKKVLDAIKTLAPDSHIEDIPYKRDGKGNIEMGADGRPVIDMAIMTKSMKGITPERLEAAINANLSADDVNQLMIDGRYSYRGRDAQGMKDVTDQRYEYKLNQMNDIIQGLTISRATANNDPQLAAQIDAKIQSYKERAEAIQSRYGRDIAAINNNLEGYKGSFYAGDWIKNFSDSYAHSEESLTYKENPYFMAAERRRENDIKFQEFLVNQQWKAADSAYKAESLKLGWYNAETARLGVENKAKGKKTAQGGLEGIPLSDAVLEPVDQNALDEVNKESFLKETQAISDDIDQQKMALLGNTGLVTIKRSPDGTQPRYEYNVAGKDPKSVIAAADAAIAKLKDAYDKDPNSVDDGTRTYFDNLANADQVMQNRKFSINKLQSDADKEHSLEPVLKNITPITLNIPGKGNIAVSREQQVDFNDKLQKIRERKAGAYGVPYYSYNDATAEKLLVTPEEKYMYNVIKQSYGGNPGDEQFRQNIRKVEATIGPEGRSITRARDTYMNNAVRSIVGTQEPVSFTLEAFKAEDRNRAKAVATNLVGSMSRAGKGSPGEYFDRGDASKMLSKENDDNTTYSLYSKGRGQYSLRMNNENVNKEGVDIPLTKAQAEELFGQGQFLDDFYNIRQSLQLSKNTAKWTTDVRGLGKESAFNLHNGLTNKYSVKYHVEEPLKNGGLQVRMYIYDKTKKEWLPEMTAGFGQLLNEAQVTKFLSTAGDQYIDAKLLEAAQRNKTNQ